MRSPQTLTEADRRLVAGWAADCAERVLGLFEAEAPHDDRPRAAIARARAYARGELNTAAEIRRRFVGGVSAADVKSPVALAAARAAGQAVAVCHMGAHALGAAAYAVRAASLAASDRPQVVEDEIGWQLDRMAKEVRTALRSLPPVGVNPSGPLGPGLLASGQLGTTIRKLQAGLTEGDSRDRCSSRTAGRPTPSSLTAVMDKDDTTGSTQVNAAPDSSAVRTALWRALHVQLDAPPHLIDDEIGLALAAPESDWRDRPDMHPVGTGGYRAAMVARTRFVEDLLVDEGMDQYVLLGAGLDTFAQRHSEHAGQVKVFEVDQPGCQAWKRQRLEELGYGVACNLRLVPVDFEAGGDWWKALLDAGFDKTARALVSSSGVSMYITKAATAATLSRLAGMAPGSIVAMTFMLPFDLADEADRPGLEAAERGAQASGTPWISFYTPEEIMSLARDAGFSNVRYVPTDEVAERYLAGRSDGLKAAGGEGVLLART